MALYYKYNMLINDLNQSSGWSESIYLGVSDSPFGGSVSTMDAWVEQMAQQRLTLGSLETTLFGLKRQLYYDSANPSNPPGRPTIINYSLPYQTPNAAGPVYNSFKYLAEASDGTHKVLHLPAASSVAYASNLVSQSSVWQTRLSVYANYHVSNGYLKGHDFNQLILPVASITTGGLVTTTIAHGLAVGAKVRLRRVHDDTGKSIQGVYVVSAVPTNMTAQLFNYAQANPVANSGNMQAVLISMKKIVTCVQSPYMCLKKTGRVWGQPKGRASR